MVMHTYIIGFLFLTSTRFALPTSERTMINTVPFGKEYLSMQRSASRGLFSYPCEYTSQNLQDTHYISTSRENGTKHERPFEKRQYGPGPVSHYLATYYFSCPYSGARTIKLGWTVDYSWKIFSLERDLNIEYFSEEEEYGENPLVFSARFHSFACGKIDGRHCSWEFQGFFEGAAFQTYINQQVITNPSRRGTRRPMVLEKCARRGQNVTPETRRVSCQISTITAVPLPRPAGPTRDT